MYNDLSSFDGVAKLRDYLNLNDFTMSGSAII